MLDLHRLFLLRELAARRTVSAVADALHYSRSAVSQQLTKLEHEAGVELFEHVGRTLQLTDAGHMLLQHAENLLDHVERAEADLEATQHQVRGSLRIGIFQTAAIRLLPIALGFLGHRHPALRISTLQANPEQALPALELGDLDVVVGQSYDHSPLSLANLQSEKLLRDPVQIALPRLHQLAKEPGPVSFGNLTNEVWVTGESGTGIGDMAVRICIASGGFRPDIRYFSNDVAVMQSLVAGGHAVALVPNLAQADSHPEVVVRDLRPGPFGRDIFVATRITSGQRPAVRAFTSAIREALSQQRNCPQATHPGRRQSIW